MGRFVRVLTALSVTATAVFVPSVARAARGLHVLPPAYITSWRMSGLDRGIATDAAGNVYVTGDTSYMVREFSSTGSPVADYGACACGVYQGGFARVAVDGSGDVFVINPRSCQFGCLDVYKYLPNGDLAWTYPIVGLAVAAVSSGDTFVAGGDSVTEIAPGGTAAGSWSLGFDSSWHVEDESIAVSPSTGNLVVASAIEDHLHRIRSRVQVFTPAGKLVASWGASVTPDRSFFPIGVSVSPNGRITVFDSSTISFYVFNSTGTYLGRWGQYGNRPYAFRIGGLSGLAFAPSGGLFVADSPHARVVAYGPTPAHRPDGLLAKGRGRRWGRTCSTRRASVSRSRRRAPAARPSRSGGASRTTARS